MARNRNRFAELTPDNPAPHTPSGRTPAPARVRGWSRQRWLILGVGLVVVGLCGLLMVNSCARHAGTARHAVTVQAAHGPIGLRGGVPVGYTHDRAGAATAAVNTLQALTQAGQGRVRMDAVVTALTARDPGPGLRQSIEIGRDRPEDPTVVNLIPVAASVSGFSSTAAHVRVWTLALSPSAVTTDAPTSVMTAWATHEVDLVWQRGDWKAKEIASHPGPTPDEAGASAADSVLAQPVQSGFYAFYVN